MVIMSSSDDCEKCDEVMPGHRRPTRPARRPRRWPLLRLDRKPPRGRGMFWDWLLDASHFMTRNLCGVGWTPTLKLFHQISNLVIAISYFLIPIALFFLYKKKRNDLPSLPVFVMFMGFLVLCGLT